MKLLRITDHKIFNSLSDHEKLCYRLGLPIRFMGHNIKSMVFVDYTLGSEVPVLISAVKQKRKARLWHKTMSRNSGLAGILGCYSSPTDTAAFECAGALFEAGVAVGMSCLCISVARIAMDLFNIPKNDMYVIYGITDLPNPQLDRNLSSFLYERDGSMRILVMSGSGNTNPWKIAQQQLHLRLDALLVLNDENSKNSGSVEKVG
jgi:hypothetical protein